MVVCGAEGRIRTGMRLPSTVFETVASTIPPLRRDSDYSGACDIAPEDTGESGVRFGWGRTDRTLRIRLERKTGFEPATFSLARRRSTPEPLPLVPAPSLAAWCRGPDLNWGHQHFQCCALPTELPRPGRSMLRSGLEGVNRAGTLYQTSAERPLAGFQAHERLRVPDALHYPDLIMQE